MTNCPTELAKITIIRRKMLQDIVRTYVVFIDAQRVGTLRPFKTGTYLVSPGDHQLELRLSSGSTSSDLIDVSLKPGEVREFRTMPHGLKKDVLQFLAIYVPRLAVRPWIYVEEVVQS